MDKSYGDTRLTGQGKYLWQVLKPLKATEESHLKIVPKNTVSEDARCHLYY